MFKLWHNMFLFLFWTNKNNIVYFTDMLLSNALYMLMPSELLLSHSWGIATTHITYIVYATIFHLTQNLQFRGSSPIYMNMHSHIQINLVGQKLWLNTSMNLWNRKIASEQFSFSSYGIHVMNTGPGIHKSCTINNIFFCCMKVAY